MHRSIPLAAALVALALAPAASAQVARSIPGQPEARTALDLMPAPHKLTVTTPAFKDGGDIPFENTQYRGNIFPGLSWSKGPEGTKAYVLIMQDNDLILRGAPILHWTMINIPASVTTLDVAMSAPPAGAAYGPNVRGAAQAYMGPRTPPGPKDHYHFQIFALAAPLELKPDAGLNALTNALKADSLATGELIATFEVPGA